MRGIWKLPEQAIVPPAAKIVHVLVEYNGPQVVVARDNEGLKLGVAADDEEDSGLVRWLYAPLTDTEFKALVSGASTIRDALLKPRVYVIDFGRDDRPLRAWEHASELLDETVLPRRGALLPKATRAEFAATIPEKPELCLERLGAKSKGVTFRSLSELLGVFQRLWNSLAQAVSQESPKERGRLQADLSERAALALTGATAGSLILEITPSDHAIFNEVSQQFEELAKAGDDPQALSALLEHLGPRVQARYVELLKDIEKHGLQLFTRRQAGSAFLASHTAPRVISALTQSKVSEARTIPAIGYFLAFDGVRGSFEFNETLSGEVYKGHVAPEVFASHDSVVVGPGVTYRAAIEITTQVSVANQIVQTHWLRELDPYSEIPPEPSEGEDRHQ